MRFCSGPVGQCRGRRQKAGLKMTSSAGIELTPCTADSRPRTGGRTDPLGPRTRYVCRATSFRPNGELSRCRRPRTVSCAAMTILDREGSGRCRGRNGGVTALARRAGTTRPSGRHCARTASRWATPSTTASPSNQERPGWLPSADALPMSPSCARCWPRWTLTSPGAQEDDQSPHLVTEWQSLIRYFISGDR